jgi:hypothetical protein
VNVDWLLTTKGRLARIAFGTILILFGLGVVGGFLGVLILLIGAVPIASAAYGTLLIGPLFGRDIHGRTPQEQPKDEPDEEEAEEDDSARDKPAARDDDSGAADDDSSAARKPDPDWEAPPLATAEREPGQEPRTRDLRADDD